MSTNILNYFQLPETQKSVTPNFEDILVYFQLPIDSQEKTQELSIHIQEDLELNNPKDNNKSINQYIFNPTNNIGNFINTYFTKKYSYDKHFLKDTQNIIKKITVNKNTFNVDEVWNIWEENKKITHFKEKFYYLEWECLEMFNKEEMILMGLSVFNLTSPILTLVFPIVVLILPFFILQLKGSTITIDEYINVLKQVLKNHALGKLFFEWNDVNTQQKMYILLSLFFYLFSIYQNVMYCVKFYKNIITIHEQLLLIKDYLKYTIEDMDTFLPIIKKYKTYKTFYDKTLQIKNKCISYYNSILFVTPFEHSVQKISQLGKLLKVYYEMNKDIEMEEMLLYSLGYNGYMNNLYGLKENIKQKKINKVSFGKETKMNNVFYPALINENYISNDCYFDKNIILTGPNASGKTTILKSSLINIIFSQICGYGSLEKGQVKIYKYIHCYLNIPDTLGRDSLFQAEARRCKDIIDSINKYPKDNHFCVFDELYSGTNPKEAISSATAFMEYIIKNENVDCLLTTHFIDICHQLKEHPRICNYLMDIKMKDEKISFQYKMKPGISEICGGIDILKKLNYPKEIIDNSSV